MLCKSIQSEPSSSINNVKGPVLRLSPLISSNPLKETFPKDVLSVFEVVFA